MSHISQENNKKLFIIQALGYTFDSLESQLAQIENHFHRILSSLKISTPSGKSTSIQLNIDRVNPEKLDAKAERKSKELATYEITIKAGFSRCLWVASRALAFDEINLLPWVEECEINDKRLRHLGKREILADYAYFIGSYLIILHEISHIVLGHLDYLNDEIGDRYLSELKDEKKQYYPEELIIRKAFEAEADRQAGQWLIGFFEHSLGSNGLGGYLLFPSRLHAYEFYVYSIAMVFRMVQDLTQREGVIHPKPNERLYILIASLSEYFKQNLPCEHDKTYHHALQSCLEAGKKLLVIDSFDPLTVMLNANHLVFVDDVIKAINIRRYQHRFEVITSK
ncbi:MAG: hypothetical protein KME17_25895 [Cyanosarcina radialis HA8281-LM2]|jgi:hypothetical protein|nr:hypothetical protein [Cyanosarcina radialis HA8281-LM2]